MGREHTKPWRGTPRRPRYLIQQLLHSNVHFQYNLKTTSLKQTNKQTNKQKQVHLLEINCYLKKLKKQQQQNQVHSLKNVK